MFYTPHLKEFLKNILEVKGGPPSVLSSSEVPYVRDSFQQMDINLGVVV